MYSHLPHSPQDWSFSGENVCQILDCPALRKGYSHKRLLGEHLNSAQHTKIESRHRSTATGAYEPEPLSPILDVFEQQATVILFKHPASYGNTIPGSQADSDEQFGATVIEGTDKDVQTPQNVPDDERSDASPGNMQVDPGDAHSDHCQSQVDLDEGCDSTDTEGSSNDAETLESLSDEESDTSSTSMEVDPVDSSNGYSDVHMDLNSSEDEEHSSYRAPSKSQPGEPVTFHLLKIKNSYYDNIERICCTKWATQLSAEVALPDWMTGGLREMCIFELIKTSWHQPFNRYAWVIEKEIQGRDMLYHSNDTVRLGHIFSLACKVILNIEETREFWEENSIFLVEACRNMLEYFKTPEEVEEYLFITPAEIWSTFAEQFELAINEVKEGKDSDEELMGRINTWYNGVKKRIEGEDPLSEEFVFDEDEDKASAKRHKSLVVKLAQKKAAIEKEGEKQAKAIRAKERSRRLGSRTLGLDRLTSVSEEVAAKSLRDEIN